MPTVETVKGPVDADQLGFTLIHEHLRCHDEAVWNQWPNRVTIVDEEPYGVEGDGYDQAVTAARRAVDLDVRTIVDPTAMFLGRDVEFMRRVVRGDRPPGRALHRHLHL